MPRRPKHDYEVKAYAGTKHGQAKHGEFLVHTWHIGESSVKMDVDIWLKRMAIDECGLIEVRKISHD